MKNLLSSKRTLFFSAAIFVFSLSALNAQQSGQETLTPEGQTCHCWQIKLLGLVIAEKCNEACGDGDLSNGESSNGSGWTWFP